MAYDLFLFDLDDTLLDFKASEQLSFARTMHELGAKDHADRIFADYQRINLSLWKLFEEGGTTKEQLKSERFRQLFDQHKLEIDPLLASTRYLDTLPQTVVLIDYAVEICEWLSQRGEIGIITNGIETVQTQRIKNSKIAPFISFVSVSEACGFAKPDIRFFEYSTNMASKFAKATTLIVGDRIEADIQGAHNFGIDSCWFNPAQIVGVPHLSPKYEIRHLSELEKIAA